jgi:hypothetical protein
MHTTHDLVRVLCCGAYRVTAYRLPQYPTSPPPSHLLPPSALRHLTSFSSLAMKTYTLRMHVCVCYSLQPIVKKNKSMIYFWIRRYYLYSIRLLRVLSHLKSKLKETKEIKIVVLKVNKLNAKSPPAVAVENSSLRKPYNGQKSAS